jgi:hypothetical protein
VGVEQAHSTDLILQGKGFRLELDFVVGPELGPHIHLGGFLEVRMAELEDEFRDADGKPVLIVETPAQDERVVIEPKVCGVQEQDFPDLGERILEALSGEVNVHLFRGAPH